MKKVYCKDCEMYSIFVGCGIKKKVVHTPLKPETIYFDYKKLNKDNNCKYFKERREIERIKKKKWFEFWK